MPGGFFPPPGGFGSGGFGGGPFNPFGGNPFDNPLNDVRSWTDRFGQYNQKIVSGPDAGVHRGYDPTDLRSFQTGTGRFGNGSGS